MGVIGAIFSAISAMFGLALLTAVITFISYFGRYKMFRKMGKPVWLAFLPRGLSDFAVFDYLTGNGWQILFYLIPIYGIYAKFKKCLDQARLFGYGTGMGVCLFFFTPIVELILGLGNAEVVYEDQSRGVEYVFRRVIADGVSDAIRENGLSAADAAAEEEIEPEPEPVPARKICPSCGTANDPDSAFCENCGTRL